MKKIYLKVTALLSLAGFVSVQAREIRTPIPFMYGKTHYPVEYHDDRNYRDDDCWNINFSAFGGAYSRHADVAYGPCHGRNEVPFSTLLFGKSSFRLEEIFAGADLGTASADNPFISIATLTPKLDYHERGAVFGIEIGSNFEWCDVDYRFGLRARLPFRDTEVSNICGLSEALIGADLSDVYRERQEDFGQGLDSKSNTVFAARLDFLTALKRTLNTSGTQQDMVVYRAVAPDPNPGEVLIAEQRVSFDKPFSILNPQDTPPIALIVRNDGSVPVDERWGKPNTEINGALPANGTGLADNTRTHFAAGATTNYTPLGNDTAAQATLWVVPTLNGGPDSINEMTTGSVTIQAAINIALQSIDSNIQDFLNEQGLDFCDGRNKGLGDLDVELYLGRNWGCDEQFWTDLMFGVIFPTASNEDCVNCLQVLKQPLGNGDHFEIHGGFAAGWDARDWIKFMADLQFYGVIGEDEKIAAPFKGATVKNIGSCIKADIDWWYLVGHFDISFFASDCCGFDIGYEIYHKDCDDVTLCQKTAVEFIDRGAQELDAAVIAKNTDRTSHKLRAGFFNMIGDCEFFAGWSHVIAGKNVPRDTDWYLSMTVNF